MEQGLIHSLQVGANTYQFELCRKSGEVFGPAIVDHWWMPVTELYAQRQQRRRQPGNHAAVVNFYWDKCRAEQATAIRAAQERFLLAALVPDVRSQGSRTIFADAFLANGEVRRRGQQKQALNELLQRGRNDQLTREQFHIQIWLLLGHQDIPGELEPIYAEFCSALFDPACDQLQRGETEKALALFQDQWQKLMGSIGRRSGNAGRKLVLDMLSYEARAAFHQCYTVVWCALIPYLVEKAKLSFESFGFLAFWHRDQVDSSSIEQGTCVSLFHGHVFGLHPGGGLFLQTEAGRELMGEWLQNPESAAYFGRLLHGLYVAIYDYVERRQTAAAARRRQITTVPNHNPEFPQELQVERRRGRRRRG